MVAKRQAFPGNIYDRSIEGALLATEGSCPMHETMYSTLRKQGYGLVGRHSGVKLCHWLRKSLRGEGHCYKEEFYGIESHRCLQMSPAVANCTFKCIYCWRPVDLTDSTYIADPDDPSEIVDGSVQAHRKLVSGYGGVPDIVDRGKFHEACDPTHAAISLAGEPTLYPRLGELIDEYRKRRMTAFLVTNGSLPKALSDLSREPTQLYVSLSAPTEPLHLEVNRPLVKGSWKSIQDSLELVQSFRCRTVIRLTMVRGLNMVEAGRYSELIRKARPDFVEVKAYMFVGWSRYRLCIGNMPSFGDIAGFADEISAKSGYRKLDESASSRVVLLGGGEIPPKISRD